MCALNDLDLEYEALPEAVNVDTLEDLERVPKDVWSRLRPVVKEELQLIGLGDIFGEVEAENGQERA